MIKPIAVELVICETRFNKMVAGAPFFWKKSKNINGLWMKTTTNTSAVCIETGEIRYVLPYTRVEEIVEML
jgi:hypothetical protein